MAVVQCAGAVSLLLASTVLYLAPDQAISVTVGGSLMTSEESSGVRARGECPDKLSTAPCGPEDKCHPMNDCIGDEYNAYDACLEDCIDGCQSYCVNYCLTQPDPATCIDACYEWCEDEECPDECEDVPNVNVQDCHHTISSNKTHKMSSYTPVIQDAGSSDYEVVESDTEYCFETCSCSIYCWYSEFIEDYYCGVVDDCSDTGEVQNYNGNSTAGECPEPEE